MGKTDYFIVSDALLAEYRDKADEPQFWTDRWIGTEFQKFLERYKAGRLDQFGPVFHKYLPKDAPVIEAGCGRGQYVYALQGLGYNVKGIDFSEDLINKMKDAVPDLNAEVGDVRGLTFPDKSIGAYISLGVVEHFKAGIDEIVNEAHRVLSDDGLLLISVPHFSPIWRRWAVEQFPTIDQASNADSHFYQYYFSNELFRSELRRCGFVAVDSLYYAPYYGLKRAVPQFNRMQASSRLVRAITSRALKNWSPDFLGKRTAHMQLLVCKKAGATA